MSATVLPGPWKVCPGCSEVNLTGEHGRKCCYPHESLPTWSIAD